MLHLSCYVCLLLTNLEGPAAPEDVPPPISLVTLDAHGAPMLNQDFKLFDDALAAPFVFIGADHQALDRHDAPDGGRVIRFQPGRAQLRIHADTPADIAAYSAIEFWVHRGDALTSDLKIQVTQADGKINRAVRIAEFIADDDMWPRDWTRVRIPFITWDPTSHIITDIAFSGSRGDARLAGIKLLTSRGNAWLYTQGNRIKWSSGYNFHGSGANIQDGRSCGACNNADAWTSATEVNRRMDMLADQWHATFVRLTLESDYSESILNDPTYLQTIQGIIKYTTARGLTVLLSMWIDPSFTSMGWPTTTTIQAWQKLAATFAKTPNVIFGLVNEPQSNYDGAYDWQVWNAMNDTVKAIRAVEAQSGNMQHIIAVQGTGGWARRLDFYVKYPITGGGGVNIAYETHVYDSQSQFYTRFGGPSQTLPVIIGEYGPVNGSMTTDDCIALQQQAKQYEVPYLAWTFHENCPPNLLVQNASGCGINISLAPTAWGNIVKNDLATGW